MCEVAVARAAPIGIAEHIARKTSPNSPVPVIVVIWRPHGRVSAELFFVGQKGILLEQSLARSNEIFEITDDGAGALHSECEASVILRMNASGTLSGENSVSDLKIERFAFEARLEECSRKGGPVQ